MTERKGDWMHTFTGRQYWPADPRASEVEIADIAHALSMLCRYTGHVERFYSVAEHSWHVSHLVPPEHALAALLHDATEAYVGDMSRPMKRTPQMAGYRELEERNWEAISAAFGLSMFLPPCVHEADTAITHVEQAQLLEPLLMPDPILAGVPPPSTPIRIFAWRPEIAERMFLQRYFELTRER